MLIDDRERPEAPAALEGVRDEIHRPAVVSLSHVGALQTVGGSPPPFRALAPQMQIGLAVKPVDPFVVDVPAFTVEQHGDPR